MAAAEDAGGGGGPPPSVEVMLGHANADRWDDVEAGLAAGFDVNAATPPYHETLLFVAVHKGNMAMVARLLAAGADPNAHSYGTTILYRVAAGGTVEMLAALLASGADPAFANPMGDTVLFGVAASGTGDAEARLRLLLDQPTLDPAAVCHFNKETAAQVARDFDNHHLAGMIEAEVGGLGC